MSLADKGEDHQSFLLRMHLAVFYLDDVFLGGHNTVDCQIIVAPKG